MKSPLSKTFRPLIGALLALVVLRVWHILILRLFLDQPLILAGWLCAIMLLAILGRVLTQAVPPERRRLMDRLWMSLDGPGLTFLASFLFLVFLFHWGFTRAASDGREYFVQVRSLVIDHDLDFRNENAIFGVRGTATQYPFGGPLLWAPFFWFCHLWLGLLNALGGHFSRDGYSNPYQMAIGVGSLVYGFASLLLVYRVLADYFSRKLAAVTTLSLCAGTFVIWYLTVENSMVHGMSMFVTTLFLFLWYRTRSRRTQLQWMMLGASAGLMAMVRWQDVLFLVVPVLDGLAQSWRSETGPSRAQRVFSDAVLFGVGLLAAFSPQLVFWKIVRGAWLSPPTGEHGVHLTSLHIADVLFSSNHGLLSWTPLLYLALLGLPIFFRRDRTLFAVLVVGFLAQVYINSTVEVWWGGSGFGARRFANCMLVFGIGLASMLDWIRRRPMTAPTAVVGGLIAANVAFMLDVHDGRLPSGEGITFDRMFDSVYARVGNPFSFPQNAIVGWTYRVGWPFYDKQEGRTLQQHGHRSWRRWRRSVSGPGMVCARARSPVLVPVGNRPRIDHRDPAQGT